jgi:hypothetical protein
VGKVDDVSLDVYLRRNPNQVRDCEHCGGTGKVSDDEEVYEANITHNLNTMATEAGIYQHLWRPDELGITQAAELIHPLTVGLQLLISNPKRFKKFNPPNGWGDYEGLCEFVHKYLQACKDYPDAEVRVSR